MRTPAACLGALLAMLGSSTSETGDARHAERQAMVNEIAAIARKVAADTGTAEFDPRVMQALMQVPRHRFVPEDQSASAYRDRPLPIGHGQTISQPYVVALMTELLRVGAGDRVLEIGTGSGYQAAILSLLAREVFSIEIVTPLAEAARATLTALGHANVRVRAGDGYGGWPEAAPFDAIIVTAAPNHVPPALVEQLKPGGRMVIPVGGDTQDLLLIEKQADGTSLTRTILPVRFVPFTRDESQPK